MLKTRVISAIVGLPILFFILIKGGNMLKIALVLVSILGLNEFYNAIKNIGVRPVKIFGYLSAILLYFLESKIAKVDVLVIIAMMLFLLFLTNKKYNLKDYALTLMGIIYIPLFFLYIQKLREMPEGMYIVWFVFIVSWMTDTFAYFTGRFFGKHKLAPTISPKKTIEGGIGGIIGSTISCAVFAWLFPQSNVSIYLSVIIGLLGSIIAQCGDLIASFIKRNCYIKDFGNTIPGHGGILDRFDSILFVSPFIYFIFQYLI
ncbi:phosphatidate cytidylyltransferase [Thermoanaerobacter thermohydrosulfuricus]|jgi:phosphatidate cytidylyltransferase|uniref:Phosphatidate cytidylyltransferase n=4 Tax=Thermoanaerobacter TaxID=1754 RepID=B0K9R0_THEP3|nr:MULTISPECIES: phosphatidate cytidylyltransferase [Thermoanaerobacter]KUJ91501.1 MAG: phosphatidate cytidylyltransferase [Thermoanaerobacter thermocopriae]ABY92941.1 phosphatidate cytidylyltransferase [Thermoanaerobacter sp. X514]ABY94873.1 phosphatidate cytidylyltransferase [Thermoanaerobacter pseudethanolicus ATCC 33223]ADV79822.1 phosphatidate cytidylyltransferase [Thermoanaerobacter brockii subsp. finnii Ako-1]EMT40160.1 CDP-diglyceride synthetase [Thermoanaerobacter thermohydrosulfuricu